MPDFNQIGNTLFVTMLCVNIFLSAFAGHQLQPTTYSFGGDANHTPQSILDQIPDVTSSAIVKVTGSTEQSDIATETGGLGYDILKNGIRSALFGFADFAQIYLPPIIRDPLVFLFGTFMLFYSVIFAVNLFNLIFRGQGGQL